MAAEDSEGDTTRAKGLFDPLKAVLATFLAVLQTRLDLVSTEFEEERERFKEMILLAVISFFCVSLGILLLTLFVVVIFWDTHRFYVLGGFVALYLGLGLTAGGILRKKAMSRPKLFSATLSELAKDIERLKS
ncbi:MAG: phage holin family protein [Candidatus Binatia bacterium]